MTVDVGGSPVASPPASDRPPISPVVAYEQIVAAGEVTISSAVCGGLALLAVAIIGFLFVKEVRRRKAIRCLGGKYGTKSSVVFPEKVPDADEGYIDAAPTEAATHRQEEEEAPAASPRPASLDGEDEAEDNRVHPLSFGRMLGTGDTMAVRENALFGSQPTGPMRTADGGNWVRFFDSAGSRVNALFTTFARRTQKKRVGGDEVYENALFGTRPTERPMFDERMPAHNDLFGVVND